MSGTGGYLVLSGIRGTAGRFQVRFPEDGAGGGKDGLKGCSQRKSSVCLRRFHEGGKAWCEDGAGTIACISDGTGESDQMKR